MTECVVIRVSLGCFNTSLDGGELQQRFSKRCCCELGGGGCELAAS
jgi:hypothetical protein